ncbi:MAG: MFS transporter [Alphaproteobacteria bacterium]
MAAAHVGKVPAALPLIRAELGLDLVTAGWVVSIFNAIGVAVGMAVGVFADRFGRRRVAIGGLAALVLGSAAGAMAEVGWVLLLTRFFEGLGFVIIAITAAAILAKASQDRDRRFVLGAWGAYYPTGMAAMMLLSPPLLGAYGWRGLWLAVALATAGWLVVMWVATRDANDLEADSEGALPSSFDDIRVTVARPGPWLLAFCFGLYTLQWLALMAWMPTFLVESRGATLGMAATLTVIAVAVNIPGNLMGGYLLHRGVARWLLLAGAAALSVVLGIGIFLDVLGDPARYGLCLAYSFFVGVIPAAVLSGAPVFTPTANQLATTNGLLVHGANLGQVAGPPVVAAVVAATGSWDAGAWVFAAAGIIGTVLAFLVRGAERAATARG